jgi:hypothetical protein
LAATKISALTTDAAPHRTNDFAPTYDASAVATKKVALKDFGMYELMLGFSNSSPADATTYIFGSYLNTTLQTTGAARRLYVTRTGLITGVFTTVVNSGTAGTGETSTIYLRKNNTTDTTVDSSVVTAGAGLVYASAVGVSIAVTDGDYVEMKWVSPTWATNPTGVYMTVQLRMG